MKINTPLILVFMLLYLWQLDTMAQCDSTNDIIQSSGTSFYEMNNSRPDNIGQTFTSSCSSIVEGVSFWTDGVSGGSIGGVSVTAELWRNPLSNSTRTLIASQTRDIPFNFSDDDIEQFFVFDNSPTLTAGTEYGVVFTNNDTDKNIEVLLDVNDVFPNGKAIRNFASGGIGGWDLEFRIYYEDEVAPIARCKNITRTLGADGTVSISASNINNNSTDADSGIASFSLSQSTFDCNNVGENIVTLFVRDQNGNTDSCQAIVTVLDDTKPILTCPDDIIVNIDPGEPLPTITYNEPSYSDCSLRAPAGFTYLGTRDDKFFYLSNNTIQIDQAFTEAESLGGYVATILDADHNSFIRTAVDETLGTTNEEVLIGYNDVTEEDTFVWHDGNNTATFENWGAAQPNNAGGNEDYTVINSGSVAKWNDLSGAQQRRYILQLSRPSNFKVSGPASGDTFPIGETSITFEAADASDNVGTCTFTITVVENPFETSVVLDNGKLTITDIENDSDDQINLTSDGTTLTISNLVVPTVSGGPTKTDLTTVTLPVANITAGIEFIGGNGTNTISISSDLTLSGDDNDITISGLGGLNAYSQSGAINIGGNFTIKDSGNAFVLLGELTASNLSITGVDRIRDRVDSSPINISGQTDLQATSGLEILKSATHTFMGTVNLESERVSFFAIGPTKLGTVTTTGTDDFFTSNIRIGPGSLELTGDIITAGDSDLYLRAQTTMTQSGGTITTDLLTLDGANTGETTALLLGDNDINLIEVQRGRSMELVVLNDVDDLEVGWFTINGATLIAPTINLTNNTDIFKNDIGVLSLLGNIDISNTSDFPANIEHNGGSIEFIGDNITIEKIDYSSVTGTKTRMFGTTIFTPSDLRRFSLELGTLEVEGAFKLGPTGVAISILDELNVGKEETVFSGIGIITGGPTTVDSGATITPGTIGNVASLTVANLLISSASYAPVIEDDDNHDVLKVNGTVTLTDATLSPIGGFQAQPDDIEIILIDNDGIDAIIGTFNDLPEGSLVTFGDYGGIITYAGGDGNDVTLLPDNIDPVVVCQDLNLAIGLGGVTVTGNQLDNGSTDNAGIATFFINGVSELNFTYEDLGDHDVTITVVDYAGNTAECTATITLTSNVTLPILISEYQPSTTNNPQTIEIKGEAGEEFAGAFVVIEGDTDTSDIGVIKSADAFSGIFDANGLLVASIPNVNNPTHTVVLTSSFSGTVGVTDVDTNDDGTADDLSAFGLILDAVGVGDGGACCPIDVLYGTDFGGLNLPSIGNMPSAIFRLGSDGDFYQISNTNGNIYNDIGVVVDASDFNIVPTDDGTFGNINPLVRLSINPNAFITTWKTDNQGATNNSSIRIPAISGTFNYDIDWGDGTIDTGVTGLVEHTYNAPGTYDVAILGDFPRILFDNALFTRPGSLQAGADRLKIIDIKQWGNVAWSTMDRAFFGCENMDVTATDTPNLNNVTILSQMFSRCFNLVGTTAFNSWDVSMIIDMRSTFAAARLFNQPLNNWNVSNVTQMFAMFEGAEIFNQPLNNWNVSNVDQMTFMFSGAKDFNQNISNWNVSNVTQMDIMFSGAEDFNQPLNSWNVSNVTRMGSMFQGASSFNQPLDNWNVSKVESMSYMFEGATKFNQDITGWNVGKVEFMRETFKNATSFNWPLNSWNVSTVRSMWGMFNGASNFNQPLDNWDVSEVEQMHEMFLNATAFDQDLGDWNIQSISSGNLSMTNMFLNAGLSIDNYDNTLIGWSTLDTGEAQIPTNVIFEGGTSEYCVSETQRQMLIDTYGWTINDGGINCSTLNVDENNIISELVVYPNPAIEEIHIQGDITQLKGIEIYALTGQLILRKELVGNSKTIDIGKLESAVYFVKLYGDEGQKVIRLVKK